MISTLCFPFISVLMLYFFGFHQIGMNLWPVIRDSLILTIIPMIVSLLLSRFAFNFKNGLIKSLSAVLPFINMLIIGYLVFIYFGSSFAKMNLERLNPGIIGYLLFNACLQDFGSFWILKKIGFSNAERASFSIKNVALSGGILLIFQPQAALACSAIFLAHGILFAILSKQKWSHYFF
jgi:predicted Na+-dependent transporter